MEKISYGFDSNKKVFKLTIFNANNNSKRKFFFPFKELLIKCLFKLTQEGKISVETKEKILQEALLEISFREVADFFFKIPTMLKINFMYDLNSLPLKNPTLKYVNRTNTQMAYAYIADQKIRGEEHIFPFVRYKDEGNALFEFMYINGKLNIDDFNILKIQLNRMNLPNSILESYVLNIDNIKSASP